MNVIRCLKIIEPNLNKQILATARTKKTKSCEERDCCGNLIDDCVIPDVVVERECCPASFFTWKPIIPDLKRRHPCVKKEPEKPYEKQRCFAGMSTKDKTKLEAGECVKKCTTLPPICPQKGIKMIPPIPKSRAKCLPTADWDIDGYMD